MGAVGTKLRTLRGGEGSDYVGLAHWCPGCEEVHAIKIAGGATHWKFNGDYDAPSFSPSVRIWISNRAGQEHTICHYFIKRGSEIPQQRQPGTTFDPGKSYIDFCADSPHALSGQVVELPDWPYASGTYGGIEE